MGICVKRMERMSALKLIGKRHQHLEDIGVDKRII